MAGRNTRFHNVGFDLPKYLLPMGRSTVIAEIVSNLKTEVAPENTFLIAHERDSYFKNKLVKELMPLEIPTTNIMYIGETKGQAHTAHIATSSLNLLKTQPIFFHNADTVLYGRKLTKYLDHMHNSEDEGIIDTFSANNKEYSYVKTEKLFITEIAEKEIISNFATSGLYGFANVAAFQHTYHSVLQNNLFEGSEHFFSTVYKKMITNRQRITFLHNEEGNDGHDTLVLGTPIEYQKAISKIESRD